MQSPYRVLEVPPHATAADIRSAYRSLARRHHPDVGDPMGEPFVEIHAAYELLSDPDTREAYDRSHEGYADRRHQWRFGAGDTTPVSYSSRRHQREFARPLSMLTDRLGELFRGAIQPVDLLARGWVHEGRKPHRGEALHYDLQLSPREAASGGRFSFGVPVRRRCDACGLVGRPGCPTCGGDGYIVEDQEIELVVPARVHDGATCAIPSIPSLSGEAHTVEVTVRIR